MPLIFRTPIKDPCALPGWIWIYCNWAISADLSDANLLSALMVYPRLAITCLDQLGGEKMRYYQGGQHCQATIASGWRR